MLKHRTDTSKCVLVGKNRLELVMGHNRIVAAVVIVGSALYRTYLGTEAAPEGLLLHKSLGTHSHQARRI